MFEFITICFLSEPELDAGMSIYFFLSAVLGVVLMVKAVEEMMRHHTEEFVQCQQPRMAIPMRS